MFLAFKEKRSAKHIIKRLMEAYSTVLAENPDLSDKALYREILLHTQQVDPSRVDQILQQAEESIDQWTANASDRLGFREVAHFIVLIRYQATGHVGAVVSFEQIVNSLVPAEL